MSSYDQTQKRLGDLEKDCLSAISDLQDILAIFTEFQIKKLSGVDLSFLKTTAPSGTVKPIDAAIVEIKTKVKTVVSLFYRVFPDEFKYMNEKTIQGFKCLPSPAILGSVELKTSVSKTLSAMGAKLKSIQDKKKELNRAAFEGPTLSRALAAFFSYENFKLLDNMTTEENLLADFKRDQAAKDNKVAQETNVGVQNSLDGDVADVNYLWGILGLESVPAPSVIKKVEEFQEYLVSLQYPRSLRYCDDTRVKLNVASLQESRESNSQIQSDQSEEAVRLSDEQNKSFGRSYLATAEFSALDNRAKLKLAPSLGTTNSRLAQYHVKYSNLVQSIRSSSSRDAVRGYVNSLKRLVAELEKLG